MHKSDWTDALIAQVAQRPTVPAQEFMAQLLAEAHKVQHPPAVAKVPPLRAAWQIWRVPLGGFGVILACGLWLGLSVPAQVFTPGVEIEPYQILDVYALLEETP